MNDGSDSSPSVTWPRKARRNDIEKMPKPLENRFFLREKKAPSIPRDADFHVAKRSEKERGEKIAHFQP